MKIENQDMVDLPPDTHILESLRAEKPRWAPLFGEAIDNSLDASAKTININFLKNEVTIRDDGIGATKERITSLVQLGKHAGMGAAALGRYGVGIKYQAIAAGNVIEILSTSIDGRVIWRVDWETVIDSGVWKFNRPIWSKPSDSAKGTGTEIKITKLRGHLPEKVGPIYENLQMVFYPALASGKIITINGHRLEVLPYPALTMKVDTVSHFSGGLSARIRGGLLVDPQSKLRQVNVSYLHRVIMPKTSFGCGDVTGPMFARVELLGGGWKLSTFKDGLSDEKQIDELDMELQKVLADILEACRTKSMQTNIDLLQDRVNDLLPEDMASARPRAKHRQDRKGKKRGKKGGETENADKSKTGPTNKKASDKNKLKIVFDDADGANEEYGIGYYDGVARPRRIVLARDNPRIAELTKNKDHETSAKSLFDLAICIYASEKVDLIQKLGKTAAELMAKQYSHKAK